MPPRLLSRPAASRSLKIKDEQHTILTEQPDAVSEKLLAEVLTDKMITLNHQFATYYLELPKFTGERTVQDSHIQELYDLMRQKTFNPQLIVLATAVLGDIIYRVNGQHTCWSILGMSANAEYKVRHVHYKVRTMGQLKTLYSTFDRLLARTDSHLLKIQLVETPEAEGIAPSMIQRVAPAVRFWLYDKATERRRCSPSTLATLIRRDYSDTFQKVCQMVGVHHVKFTEMRRLAVMAAMLETYHLIPSKAEEFWSPVATGLNMSDHGDPRYVLRETLRKSAIVQKGAGRGRRNVSTEDLYRICIVCWNKWRSGDMIESAPRATQRRIKAK